MNLLLLLFLLQPPTVMPRAYHEVVLTWTDTVNPTSTTYSVHRFVGTCATAGTFIQQVAGLTTKTWTDPGIAAGGIYCYRVVATNAGLDSPPSSTAQANVPADAMSAVTNLTAVVK